MSLSVLRTVLRKSLAMAGFALLLGTRAALASDPLPGDAVAPPPNLNIVLYYNIFTDAGVLEPPHGDGYDKDTHVSLNIQALRYIRTFNVDGMLSGVQVIQPYVSYIGHQQRGFPQLPPSGAPGKINLSHSGGFIQPTLGAFIFPVAHPDTGTYLVTAFWLSPPIGNYDKDANISLTQNLLTAELEVGGRVLLLGTPTGQNLGMELWGEGYVFGSNDNATLAGLGSTAPARLSKQPSGEFRAYFPYQFYPRTRAIIVPGFFQSFGGKQYYTVGDGEKLDANLRTQETQARLLLSTYITPHWQVLLDGQYDIIAHGGPLNRQIELRVGMAY